MLFYLDYADGVNGCLQVIPSVHCSSNLNHHSAGFFRGQITESVGATGAVANEASAGTTILLHGMTPLASAPNQSLPARRTLVLSYRAADPYPLYLGETTLHAEAHVRLMRGKS